MNKTLVAISCSYDLGDIKYDLDSYYREHKPKRVLTENQMRVKRIKNKIRKRKIRGKKNMKMTVIFEGLKIKDRNYYDKAKDDNLHLWDGTEIIFEGDENNGPNDCYNYADWSALCDTGFFEDKSVNAETLYLEKCKYGFRINGYFVPCYSIQNGYYTHQITIIAIKDGEEIARIGTECE